jgi:hypothetical protein
MKTSLLPGLALAVLTLVIRGAAKEGAGFFGKFLRGAGASVVASAIVKKKAS